LAHHYSRSANASKAIEYLRRAAEQAGARSAYNDAIGYAREALRLIATLPESRERDQIELKIQMMLGPLVVAVQGFSSPQLATNIERAQELCKRAGETPEIFGVLAALWSFDHANGQLRESRVLADRLLVMAGRMQTDLATAVAHNAMGASCLWLGEFPAAREHLEIAANVFDRDLPRYVPMMQTPVTPSRCNFAWALHMAGFPDQAKRRMNEANEMAVQLRRPFSVAFANLYAIVLMHFRHEYSEVRPRSEALIELSRENGLPFWLAAGKMCLARTVAGEGEFRGDEAAMISGLAMLKEAVEELAASGADLIYTFSFIMLAEVYLTMKRADECLQALDQIAQRIEQKDHRLLEVEVHRIRGEAILLRPDGAADAERCFRRAIEIAVHQQANSWRMRAATSLARLLVKMDRRDEARAALAPAFAQFTEGFETSDLREAKALLEELEA
jgi:tetratricopeptide (TPR) repeat protein